MATRHSTSAGLVLVSWSTFALMAGATRHHRATLCTDTRAGETVGGVAIG